MTIQVCCTKLVFRGIKWDQLLKRCKELVINCKEHLVGSAYSPHFMFLVQMRCLVSASILSGDGTLQNYRHLGYSTSKAFVTKLESMIFVSMVHMTEGENHFPKFFLPLHVDTSSLVTHATKVIFFFPIYFVFFSSLSPDVGG